VHKSQGVTVDRTHVLATSHMDRHAAYVGLTRHTEWVDLHWSTDDLGNRQRLVQVLGRERLKDTSLDYELGTKTRTGSEIRAELAWAYAERRGLVPDSEIVLRESPVEPHAEQVQLRRGLFAGLKLDAGPAEPGADVPTPSEQDRERHELAISVRAYVRVWMDVDRMRQAGLPVLPHQTAALAQADRAFDQSLAGFGQDLMRRSPVPPGWRRASIPTQDW
jgi:hypothetical protein